MREILLTQDKVAIDERPEPFVMFEKLLIASNKLMSSLVDNIAELSVRVGRVEDKLDYRKQAAEERFVPPIEPAMPGIKPNRGED